MRREKTRVNRRMKSLAELFFPSSLYCSCCGNIIDETRTYRLCDFCMEGFKWNLSEPEMRNGVSYISCVEYGVLERSLIFRLKYSGDKHISRIIAEIMRDKLESLEKLGYGFGNSIIVPVPLHKKKEKKRGFNQAALIAKHLSKLTGMECLPRALIRIKETEAMRGLNAQERRANIQGSIDVNPLYKEDIKGRAVLLLDDFYTTGNTAVACVDALMKGEPSKISFISYAKRTPYEEIMRKRLPQTVLTPPTGETT